MKNIFTAEIVFTMYYESFGLKIPKIVEMPLCQINTNFYYLISLRLSYTNFCIKKSCHEMLI